METSESYIGIDVGGTKTLVALFNPRFDVLHEIKIKTHPEKGHHHFNLRLKEMVDKLQSHARVSKLKIKAIGVGCAGSVNREKGVMINSPNIPFLEDYSFKHQLTKTIQVPVFVDNDACMGLYGEHQLGAAKGLDHLVGLFLGTGVGGAIIINGQIYTGGSGEAGRIRHHLMAPIETLSKLENRGRLDDIIGRSAVLAAAAALASRHHAPYLLKVAGTDVHRIKTGMLADAVKKGDKHIEKMIRERARLTGIALSTLVDFVSPDMVILGGGLVDSMPGLFLEEIEKGLREHTAPSIQRSLKVAVTKLKDHAITTGAAKMAQDRLKSL